LNQRLQWQINNHQSKERRCETIEPTTSMTDK
jgi:hypothetical protein